MQLENNRLEQELVLMAQRVDVSEELDRLDAHVKETYKILKKEEAVGRRLDFMMQEFNRESNTLASKSINADVTALGQGRVNTFASVDELKPTERESAAIEVLFLCKAAMISALCQSFFI